MVSLAIQIPCITKHFYPGTVENILKICSVCGLKPEIRPESTCCGLPYFEKGELQAAKRIGQYNLKVFSGCSLQCTSPKCHGVYSRQYPKIFNNTVSHNDAMQLAKSCTGLQKMISKFPTNLLAQLSGRYFMVAECCSDAWLPGFLKQNTEAEWIFPVLKTACCGAGTSLPVHDPATASSLAMHLVDEFNQSGAVCMVFEDDICRRHVELSAQTAGQQIACRNLTDILASVLP